MNMNPPMEDIDLNPEKVEVEKENGPSFQCDLCDTDMVHKIAESFLPGLASACIDNTTGGILKSPVSVAVDIRREMVDYLVQRSENFVSEVVMLEGDPGMEVSDNPYDIIANFVDDFVSSKRNFFSRVSGWLMSDRREDWIEDFVQEMEINGFWLLNRRVSVAQTLLKNVDLKTLFYCTSKFKSLEDLEEHKVNCSFRTMSCDNEGCNASFSAGQMDYHDSICPFKILPCEQKCPDNIMRRDMDRHCITICPMKLVKCPFYSVGCQSLVPQRTIGDHRSENIMSHLSYILHGFHRKASSEDLKERAEEVHKLAFPGKLESARDARLLTTFVRDIDSKLGPIIPKQRDAEPHDEVVDLVKETESTHSPVKSVVSDDSPRKKEENAANSPSVDSDHEDSSHGKEELVDPPSKLDAHSQPDQEKMVASIIMDLSLKESPTPPREDSPRSSVKLEVQMEGSSDEEVIDHAEEHLASPIKQKEQTESTHGSPHSPIKLEVQMESSDEEIIDRADEYLSSPIKQKEQTESTHGSPHSPVKLEVQMESSDEEVVINRAEEHLTSPIKQTEQTESTHGSPHSPIKLEVQLEDSFNEEVIDRADENSTSPVKQKEQIEPTHKRESSESSESSSESSSRKERVQLDD